MTRIFKASTKRGASIIRRGIYNEGFYLDDVYGSYSLLKRVSWDECYNKFRNTPCSHSFHICSHNTFQYSVAWFGDFEGERAMFVETPNNSFVVLLDK